MSWLGNIFKAKSKMPSEQGREDPLTETEGGLWMKKGMEALKFELKAMEYHLNDDYENALKYYTLAIDNGLESSRVFKYRGSIFRVNNRYQEAIQDFNNSILLNPDEFEAHYLRYKTNCEIDNYEQAESDLKILVERFKNCEDKNDDGIKFIDLCEQDLDYVAKMAAIHKEKAALRNEWTNYLKQASEKSKKAKE